MSEGVLSHQPSFLKERVNVSRGCERRSLASPKTKHVGGSDMTNWSDWFNVRRVYRQVKQELGVGACDFAEEKIGKGRIEVVENSLIRAD
jgi:hypothetical protein